MDNEGNCVLLEIDTFSFIIETSGILKVKRQIITKKPSYGIEYCCRYRWVSFSGSPLIYTKYAYQKLSFLDVKKQNLVFSNIPLDNQQFAVLT